MNDAPMFDLDPYIETPEPDHQPTKGESATRSLTRRRNEMLAAGVHPATRLKAHPELGTCGTCANAVQVHGGARRYWKCKLLPITGGPGTDLRLKWPACHNFEANQPESGNPEC